MAGVHASAILVVYSALLECIETFYSPTSSFDRNYNYFYLQWQCV